LIVDAYSPTASIDHLEANILERIRTDFEEELGSSSDQDLLEAYARWEESGDEWETFPDHLYTED
jgi:hypothetical protein